ncbi:MAG: GGDEF domain-containing protein [Ruminococcaceae bacterium]|nr:GGDEF domain-containing protein [Oscillospiraceae bacterium]
MNSNFFNIQFELLSLVLLSILYFFHRGQKEIKGYKILGYIYLFSFMAALTNIAYQITALTVSEVAVSHIVSWVYASMLSLVWFFWLLFFAEKFGFKQFKLISKKLISAIPLLLVSLATIFLSKFRNVLLVLNIIYPIGVIVMALYKRNKNSIRENEERLRIAFAAIPAVLISIIIPCLLPGGFCCSTFGIELTLLILLVSFQHDKAVVDRLTNLPNRYGMDEEIEEQLAQYRRDQSDSFYVIACDMDNFKTINDTWGHAEGDRALRLVAKVLNSVADRNNSTAFRNGGDEFIIITDKSERNLAEKICEQVEQELEQVSFRDDFTIRISMGIALYDGITPISELLKRADGSLYDAKKIKKHT